MIFAAVVLTSIVAVLLVNRAWGANIRSKALTGIRLEWQGKFYTITEVITDLPPCPSGVLEMSTHSLVFRAYPTARSLWIFEPVTGQRLGVSYYDLSKLIKWSQHLDLPEQP